MTDSQRYAISSEIELAVNSVNEDYTDLHERTMSIEIELVVNS